MARVWLDVFMGDSDDHARAQLAYDATTTLLDKNATIYGLPPNPLDLSEEQQDILRELDVFILHSSNPSNC